MAKGSATPLRGRHRYAEANDVPTVRFKKGDRKAEVMKPYLAKATKPGVVAIGVAQEMQKVFTAPATGPRTILAWPATPSTKAAAG